jgi:hypothetical protein
MDGNNENVLVEKNYNNIVIVDPNKVSSLDGKVISERLVKHENLVMYANLEAYVLPRTRLNVSAAGNLNARTVSVGKINFLQPAGKSFLTNQYTDDMVGGNVDNTVLNEEKDIQSTKEGTTYDSELLLITQINIDNEYSISKVTIELEDVRGRALFEKGENSPYAAFFNYPTPMFYLTIKGYYGKAMKLQLAMTKFSARFNTATGNFNVTLNFLPYKYDILSKIKVDYLYSLPFMYQKNFTISPSSDVNAQSASNSAGNSNKGDVIEKASSYGRQKLHEVYSEYKDKNLIDKNFPELTLQELASKIDMLETNLTNLFKPVDLKAITDAENFDNALAQYEKEIFLFQSTSWFDKYMDTKNYLVDDKGRKIYTFKKEVLEAQGGSKRFIADSELSGKTVANNKILKEIETYGVESGISYETIRLKGLTSSNIDWEKSFLQRTGKDSTQSKDEFNQFKKNGEEIISNAAVTESSSGQIIYYWYFFEGEGSFMKQIENLRSELKRKSDIEQEKISKDLASKIQEKEGGLGFKPLLKNFIAVVLANTEAFIRLMCDVHENAWEQRNEDVRRKAILDFTKSIKSVDAKDSVEKTDSNLIPIYPWPQYFVQNSSEKEPYTLQYPGDSRYINTTKGYLYNIWPEVEFVEEFLRGRVLYGKAQPSLSTLSDESQVSDKVSLNVLDFPLSNRLYSNKQVIKFLYEIWERIYLYSNYGRFMKPGTEKQIVDLIVESEFINIFNSVTVDSPDLLTILRDISFNANNYISSLENFSAISYPLFERDVFITDYIRQEISNYFSISEITDLDLGGGKSPELTKINLLKDYLKENKSNPFNFVDTFPFNDFTNWYNTNMASAKQTSTDWNNTTKVLLVNEKTNMISNFSQYTTINENRPVTTFNYNKATQPNISQLELKQFYLDRQNSFNSKQQPTEGNLVYIDYDGNLSFFQTTSMMNTPYFVNSLLDGVKNLKANSTMPFLSSAYLFVNSLPLATLREKFKTDKDSDIDLDYIFASMNKFGSLQKMPYHWVLKYGSIWYRYKTWINTKIDILSDCWKNFDRINNFDPITQNQNKTYNLTLDGSQTTIFLQSSTTISNSSISTMNVGFYPKVINDMNYLFLGKDLFTTYSDSEIQSFIGSNSGFTTTYGIPYVENYTSNPRDITTIRTYSCLLNLNDTKQAIIPSFGSNLYQINYECYNDSGTKILSLLSNDSIYNGSVRTFWALPNYGYFDNSKVLKPNPDEYIKVILSDTPDNDKQEAFSIRYSGYSKIEELFSVFNKTELDLMADEFVNFCKPRFMYEMDSKTVQNSSSGQPFSLPVDSNSIYKNFHNLILNLLTVDKTTNIDYSSINVDTSLKQFNYGMSLIRGLMEYDVIIKNGNPSDFDRKLFDSFSNRPPVEPYTFGPYLLGSLPESTNTTLNLSDYENSNPNAWKELFLSVGFSTIDKITYTKTGSTITDFFKDMNIEFNQNNVKVLSPLIKIYATQKAKNINYNKTSFINDVTNYLNENKKFSDLVLDSLLKQLQAKLPVVEVQKTENQPTAVESNQVKLSVWETFKSINDLYISGEDYTKTTFMDDVLLLDRANRNISDYVFLDPFIIKRNLPQLADAKTYSVFTFLRNVIKDHNFNVEMMTAYVNYYYTGEEPGSGKPPVTPQDFGNILFGTYLSVDTQYSSPKIVCKSVSVPSKHLAMDKDPINRFSDDIFYLERTNNSLVEDVNGKNDYDKSNKVVAFNVDIGTRNQNIFYNFDVTQDSSKETYESLQNIDYLVAASNGKKTATANYSAWDFYKSRSYACTIRSMGNALIQPGMYFNLRYVPMFYGPYMISTVKHSITPGLFETTFTGMRQSAYAYETISNMDEYLQQLTRQIYNSIKNKTTQNNKTDGDSSKQSLTERLNGVLGGDIADQSTCEKLLPKEYNKFIYAQQSATTTSVKSVVDNLKQYFPYNTNNVEQQNNKRRISFFLMYYQSYSKDSFICYNYNYCGLLAGTLKQNTSNAELKKFGGNLANFIEKKYLCIQNSNGSSLPFATFESESQMYQFLKAKWDSNIYTSSTDVLDDIAKNYYKYWNKNLTENEWLNFKNNNVDIYNSLVSFVKESEQIAVSNDLYK